MRAAFAVLLAAATQIQQCDVPADTRVVYVEPAAQCRGEMVLEAPFNHEVLRGLKGGDCIPLPAAVVRVRLCCDTGASYACGPIVQPLAAAPNCTDVRIP